MSEPNWKQVAETFLHACNDGDGEMIECMIERYEQYFKQTDEDS